MFGRLSPPWRKPSPSACGTASASTTTNLVLMALSSRLNSSKAVNVNMRTHEWTTHMKVLIPMLRQTRCDLPRLQHTATTDPAGTPLLSAGSR